MIYIAKICLRNYLCYRGEHTIELGPLAYALFAEDEKDAEISNGLGKTAIIEAPVFAMFGKHKYEHNDDLITRGEIGGEVRLELSDGSWIRRHQVRGKSIVIESSLKPFGSKLDVLRGADAETAFLAHVGIEYEDFRYTSWFEQRQTARIVLADPAPRMKIVSAWLSLERLEDAQQHAERSATVLGGRLVELRNLLQAQTTNHEIARARVAAGAPSDEALQALLAASANSIAKLEAGVKVESLKTRAERVRSLVTEGKSLVAEQEKEGRDLAEWSAAVQACRAIRQTASEELGKRRLQLETATRAAVKFDGQCPILRAECPARSTVEQSTALTTRALEEARFEFQTANEIAIAAQREENAAVTGEGQARRRSDRIKDIREQVASFRFPSNIDEVEPVEVLRRKVEESRQALQDAEWRRKSHDEAQLTVAAGIQKLADLEQAMASVEREREAALAASQVLGRNGAQKAIAVGSLAQISAGANASLEESGINLRVEFTWGSEGVGLAKHCQKCGAPFPTSTRVKLCEKCGEERGQHIKPRLDIALSDRSGALDDLAGIAIQLSAAAWLRTSRGFAWSTALLDEPFGALDARNRRALATHLAALLSGRYGFAQAIVVAHQRSALSAFPGRIVVRRLANGDRTVTVD